MDNERARQGKIVKMKVQTAKVLWQEDRREAAFLVLESVDDPRADDLRGRLSSDEHYDVGRSQHQGVSWPLFGGVVVITMVVAFALSLLLNPGPQPRTSVPVPTEDTVLTTAIPPTLPVLAAEVELTGTASQIQLTQSALEAQQRSSMGLLDATETARYEQATGTANARETAAAGG